MRIRIGFLYGKQRNGAYESTSAKLDEFRHIHVALNRVSPIGKVTAVPLDFMTSLEVAKTPSPNDLSACGDVRCGNWGIR